MIRWRIVSASACQRSASTGLPRAVAMWPSATLAPYTVAERSGHNRGSVAIGGHLRASSSGQRLGMPAQRGLLSWPVSYVQKPSTRPVLRVSRYSRSHASQRLHAVYAVTSNSSSPLSCDSSHAVAAIGTTIWIWPYPPAFRTGSDSFAEEG